MRTEGVKMRCAHKYESATNSVLLSSHMSKTLLKLYDVAHANFNIMQSMRNTVYDRITIIRSLLIPLVQFTIPGQPVFREMSPIVAPSQLTLRGVALHFKQKERGCSERTSPLYFDF